MANTTDIQGRTISIILDGSTDWSWDSSTEKTAAPELIELSRGHIFIDSMEFDPAATDDKIIVREVSLTGPPIFRASGANVNDQRIKDFHGKDFRGIFIAAADVLSYGSAATLTIIMA